MRGLCNIIAALWLFSTADTLVVPSEEVSEKLGRGARTVLAWDQPVPQTDDESKIQVPHSFSTVPSPGDEEDSNGNEDEDDFFRSWLEEVEAPSLSTASVFTSTLLPSLTLTPYTGAVTPSPEYSDLSKHISPTSTIDAVPTPYQTSPSIEPLNFSSDQKPLGGLSKAWRVAKAKAQGVAQFIEQKLPTCSQKPPLKLNDETGKYGHHVYDKVQDGRVWSVPGTSASSGHTPWSSPSSYVQSSPVQSSYSSALPTARAKVDFSNDQGSFNAPGQAPATNDAVGQNFDLNITDADSSHNTSDLAPSFSHISSTAIALIISLLATISIAIFFYTLINRRNPRRRAERLAAIEECKNRNMFRRARLQHELRGWGKAVRARLVWVWPPPPQSAENPEAGFNGPLEKVIEVPPPSYAPPGYDASASESEGEGSSIGFRTDASIGPVRKERGKHTARLLREITSFREAHVFVNNMVRAEEGRGAWSAREQRRTAMWLFGGRARRQRAGSLGSDSDKSEKSGSGDSVPPPYEDRENYVKVDENRFAQVEAGLGRAIVREMHGQEYSDASSVSSVVPTSPLGTSFTFSAGDPESDKE